MRPPAGVPEFRDEQLGQISQANGILASLRRVAPDELSRAVEDLYRILFELNVAATSLGLSDVARLSAAVQALVDAIRSHSLVLSDEVTSVLASSLSSLRSAVAGVAATNAEGEDPDRAALILQLSGLCAAAAPLSPEADSDGESDLEAFVTDSEFQLRACEAALEGQAFGGEQVHSAFRAMHTFKGNCGMLGIPRLESVARTCEDVLSDLRSQRLAPTRVLRGALVALIARVRTALVDEASPGAAGDEAWRLEQRELAAATQQARMVAADTRLGALLVHQNLADSADIETALAIKDRPLGEILVQLNALTSEQLDGALHLQHRLREGGAHAPAENDLGGERRDRQTTERPQMIQVQARRLEELLECIDRLAAAAALGEPNVGELAMQARRCAEELRLVPLRGLFAKLRTVALQASVKQGKRIEFIVDSPDLELDQELARAVSDSLLHVVRNAVDHGIEPESERLQRQKPAAGKLHLSVRLAEGDLHVAAVDDGRGLDHARLIERARELGIVLEHVSEDSAIGLIFEPGFTTATQVSDTSGRGVGMDAVREAVTRVGGTVKVSSSAGSGTSVVMAFPKGTATIDGRAVRLGGQRGQGGVR